MSGDILSTVNTRATPQSEKSRPDQVLNKAGGYVFAPGDETDLHRFLTLGTAGSTYYTSARELTRENAEVLFRMISADPIKVVNKIVEISTAGRAPKQQPAIFALAVVASHANDEGRKAALSALPRVARTASTLATFIKYCEQFRGWGRGLRNAVSNWYLDRPVDQLAYQLLKYRQREGWTHADILRSAHPTGSPEQNALFNWVAATSPSAGVRRQRHGKTRDLDGVTIASALPKLIGDFERLQAATIRAEVLGVLRDNSDISWEMIPDAFLNDADVWSALIESGVPQTALMRQLPRLTRLGLCSGSTGRTIAAQLVDADRLRKARVHPVNVLVAQKTYAQGRGEKGSTTWVPERIIVDALDAAFYAAYGAVEPSGKRVLIALDVSGSMDWANCSGLPITPKEATAAISLVTVATEPAYEVVGFCSGGWSAASATRYGYGYGHGISKLDISPRRRLDDVTRYISHLPAGGTDCALPMVWADSNREQFDLFYVMTDNETWAGQIQPHQALERYRQRMGIDARLVVAAMTANGRSICDPKDPRQLDISGFDSSCPQLVADFGAGRI